jgi:hypothetical protein
MPDANIPPEPFPRLSHAQALCVTYYKPLPIWPASTMDQWQVARSAFAWAVAVAECYGANSWQFIQEAAAEAKRRDDTIELVGWHHVATGFEVFFKTPGESDIIN